MFTVKQGEYDLTINCEPHEFIWKKRYERHDHFVYKYPDVPEFSVTIQIPGDEKVPGLRGVDDGCPNVGESWFQPLGGQRWVVSYIDWSEGHWVASTQGTSPTVNPTTYDLDIVRGPYFNAIDVKTGTFVREPTR